MKTVWMFSLGAILTFSVGCGETMRGHKGDKAIAPFDVNKYAVNKLVCDPFGSGQPQAFDQGLKATLYYLKTGQSIPHSLADMMGGSAISTSTLFFTNINVPTRLFSAGFPLESGGLVKDDTGKELIEYFGLRFEGGLRLSPQDEEGTYEFALLSDDGATMSVQIGDNRQMIVENDGDHPTKMGCGSTLSMTRESQYNVRFDYYQGPRFHISVIPMWRKVNGARMSEPQCGQLGNEMYFDYNNNSKPQAAYLNLLMRGWKPIAASNYMIPVNAGYNPCVQGEVPVISNFTARNSEGVITASWTTNIPATTQLLYKDVQTGEEKLTTADNTLTTTHSVTVNAGVSFGFDVQGVSVSGTMGRAISPVIRVF